MIIDCHGHFTTAPAALRDFRAAQLARLDDPAAPAPIPPEVSDDELRAAVEGHQLREMRERGIDLMVLSPQASAMEHHRPDAATAQAWARASNDLVHRVAELHPAHFAAAAQLPQTPDGDLSGVLAELRRTVTEMGFVAVNVNPDPSGGWWTGAPVTDPAWFPLWEAVEELDVPAMVHVSASCNPNFYALGPHYLNADTAVFMQLIEGDLFDRFPRLRLVIPHGGGAVPYHWGRFRGLAARLGRPEIEEHLLDNVFFDTCVYHQAGIDLLLDVVPTPNVLFAAEMLGAVRGADPRTGRPWDDTLHWVRTAVSDPERLAAVCERNVRRIYPRLDARLGKTNPADFRADL